MEQLPTHTTEWVKPGAEPSNPDSAVARKAALDAVNRIHDPEYVEYVEQLCQGGGGGLDQDTYVAPLSFEVALLAQSAWLDAVDYTTATGRPSFALVRPPGHHALKSRGMGFCSFNFCAAAAVHALEREPGEGPVVKKVAIFDWDVHHGNGVAALVEDDPRIRYCSIHEDGNFPNTGNAEDTGKSGHGNLLHLPLPAGSGWAAYEATLVSTALPWLQEFEPDLVLVSAGFDALALDPLARQELTSSDFGKMATLLRGAVGDKVVLGLEGGYSLDPQGGLAEAVAETVAAFAVEEGESARDVLACGGGESSGALGAPTTTEAAAPGVKGALQGGAAESSRAQVASAGDGDLPSSASSATGDDIGVWRLRAMAFREFDFESSLRLLRRGLMGKREFVASRFFRFRHLRSFNAAAARST